MSPAFWSFAVSAWTVAAAIVLMGGSLWLSIRHVRANRGARWLGLLETVRLIAVALMVLTLFRPERVSTARRIREPALHVLSDATRSMQTRDVEGAATGICTRASWVKEAERSASWEVLRRRYKIVASEFGAASATNEGGVARDPGTDLNRALESVLAAAEPPRAVVMLSDGDWTAGVSPVTAATRLRVQDVPVFAVAVGSETYLPDVELVQVSAPAYALVDESVALPFTIQSRLGREVRTQLTVESGGCRTASKEVVIPPGGQVQDSILVTPQEEGTFPFTVRIGVEPDEISTNNNLKAFSMALRREMLKVLVVESVPRWEYRFLRNALLRDPGVEPEFLLLHPGMGPGDGRGYLKKFPATRADLQAYDVVFLGDVGVQAGQLTAEQVGLLKGLVEQQGSGLVFLPGQSGAHLTLAGTALEPLMPVILEKAQPRGVRQSTESSLVLTELGQGHLLTRLEDSPAANGALWRRLPGFIWYAAVDRAKPGTEILAVHGSARNAHGRIPLLVTRSCGSGKTLFMGTDSAWRWRRGVEDLYHYRFWGQVVRWMAHQRHLAHEGGIRFFYSPETPAVGETVSLNATVLDRSGFPAAGRAVQVRLRGPRGSEEVVPLQEEAGGWGVYRGSFVAADAGKYGVTVSCEAEGRSVNADVAVRPREIEIVGRPARPDVLAEVAAVTRGECVSAKEFEAMIGRIALLPDAQPIERRFRLWCHPVWLALLAGLLTLVWAGRKLAGMV